MSLISRKKKRYTARELLAKTGEVLIEGTTQETLTKSSSVLTEAKRTNIINETQMSQLKTEQQNDFDTLDELK